MFPLYTKLSILFNSKPTPLIEFKIFAEGNYGVIYSAYNEIENYLYVVKSIEVKKQSLFSLTLLSVIK